MPRSQIRGRCPAIGILVLSQYVEERYATELLGANTPAIGYLLKDRIADVGEFLGAVRAGRRAAAPRSIPRWSRSCSPAAVGATRSSG